MYKIIKELNIDWPNQKIIENYKNLLSEHKQMRGKAKQSGEGVMKWIYLRYSKKHLV